MGNQEHPIATDNRGIKARKIIDHLTSLGIPPEQAKQMLPEWWLAVSTAAGAQPASRPNYPVSRKTQQLVVGVMSNRQRRTPK